MQGRIACIGLLLIAIVAFGFQSPKIARADATFCKWDFPWPRTVYYYIDQTYLTSGMATRIEYGGNTWTEGGFNLLFQRSYSQSTPNTVYLGDIPDPTNAGYAYVYPNTTCNRDTGNPITSVDIVFNIKQKFHEDCLAAKPFCQNNWYFDLHNTSSHEFGHAFFLSHSAYPDTMDNGFGFGDTYNRDLTSNDRYNAWLMYGCRAGFTCH